MPPDRNEAEHLNEVEALRGEVASLQAALARAQVELGELRHERELAAEASERGERLHERCETDLKRLQEQLAQAGARLLDLRESEERYRILTEASLVGVYVLQEGRMVYLNPPAAEALGYSQAEAVGMRVADVCHPDDWAMVAENMRRRIDGEVDSTRYMARLFRKDGQIIEVELFGSRATYQGRPAIVGTVLDRTEEMRTLRALRFSEARFQAFMEHTPTYAFLKDDDGRFVYANRAFHDLLDMPPQSIVGRRPHDLFPAVVADVMVETDRVVLEQGQQIEVMNSIPGRTGVLRTVLVLKFPVEDPSGRRLVGGVAVDITERKRAEEALAEQTRVFQSILESMGDGVAVTNEEGEFVIFNAAARRITGLGPLGSTPEEWVSSYGVYRSDGTTPLDPRELPLARAIRGESTDKYELLVRNPAWPEGNWMTVTGRPLVDERGNLRGGVVVFRETTEERRTLDQLRQAEAKYRALVEQLPVVSYMKTFGPIAPLLFVSPQVEGLSGYTAEEWLREPELWARIVHPDDLERVIREVQEAETRLDRFMSEYRILRRDGRLFHVHDEAVYVRNMEGEPVGVQGIVLDITELEKERGRRERLQALSRDLVEIQEAERRRIGLELHDEVGQVLTGLKLRLGTAVGLPPQELERRVAEATSLVDDAITHVRELSQSLRPSVLDDLGLLPALASYFGRYSRQTGVRVRFEHEGLDRRRFPPEVETAAYRIVQEALTNVARHARVDWVRVRTWADEATLRLEVEDAGAGFEESTAHPLGRSQGLTGMRERAALLRGHVGVESAPGKGTVVRGELPLDGGSDVRRV